jgi:hypothetical protein
MLRGGAKMAYWWKILKHWGLTNLKENLRFIVAMVGDLAHPTSKRLPMYRQTKSTTNLQVSFLKQKESQTQERSCVPVSMGNGFLSTFFLSPKWENQHLSPLVLGGCHRDSPRAGPPPPPRPPPPPPPPAAPPPPRPPPPGGRNDPNIVCTYE